MMQYCLVLLGGAARGGGEDSTGSREGWWWRFLSTTSILPAKRCSVLGGGPKRGRGFCPSEKCVQRRNKGAGSTLCGGVQHQSRVFRTIDGAAPTSRKFQECPSTVHFQEWTEVWRQLEEVHGDFWGTFLLVPITMRMAFRLGIAELCTFPLQDAPPPLLSGRRCALSCATQSQYVS